MTSKHSVFMSDTEHHIILQSKVTLMPHSVMWAESPALLLLSGCRERLELLVSCVTHEMPHGHNQHFWHHLRDLDKNMGPSHIKSLWKEMCSLSHSSSMLFFTQTLHSCAHLFVYVCLRPLQLLQHGSTAVLCEPDLIQVMEATEKRGVKELGQEAALALRLLLTQVQ